MSEVSNVRIFIAEDHEMVREGLKAVVEAQPDMNVVGEANNGLSAVQGVLELQPDVVLMDVSMPKMNGAEAATRIKQKHPQIKVLALTRHTDTAFIRRLFRSGVSGYLLKQSAAAELVSAIRTLARGNTYIDPNVTGQVINGFSSTPINLNADLQPNVSEREEEVLKMVAWGYSNKEIGARLDISVKTVEAHKANAMKKLDLHSRIDVVRYALLQGWLREN